MLMDRYKRKIDYLRISLTDRCNLRCLYCLPQEGILLKAHSEMLSFEEIVSITKICIAMGINKIKISGGEPLVRKGVSGLLESLIKLPNLKDVTLTTNGTLLTKYIQELKNTGLKKINISLDTLDAQKFSQITRTGNLQDVLEGIDAASEEGFFVKLNVVVMKGINESEILEFAQFACEKKLVIRFIELMPMMDNQQLNRDLYLSGEVVRHRLQALGSLRPVYAESFGNGPAHYFKIENLPLVVGFISPLSCKFCSSCNRIRLTSTGMLMPCLASKQGWDLRGPLRQNKEEEVLARIREAVLDKPLAHDFVSSFPRQYLMSQIGG